MCSSRTPRWPMISLFPALTIPQGIAVAPTACRSHDDLLYAATVHPSFPCHLLDDCLHSKREMPTTG
jgi:hypothetical protein